MNREIIVCRECGSPDIVKDATAKWDPDQGDWTLCGVNDCETCNWCGATRDGGMRRISLRVLLENDWTDRDDEAAERDGWSLFINLGQAEIESAIDEETDKPHYESSEEALARVGFLAMRGLEFARKALAHHFAPQRST